MTTIRNAQITNARLGFGDHGFECWVFLDYGGAAQAFGGYRMGMFPEGVKKEIGTAFAHEYLMRVLRTVGVAYWDELKGRPCRARIVDGLIEAIGHYIKDEWFSPKELAGDLEAGA